MKKKSTSITPKPPRPTIPPELYESLAAGSCVLFAGSGLSARAGLPTWTQLLSGLLKFGHEQALIDAGTAKFYAAALHEGEANSVADGIVYAFSSAREQLQDYLRRSYPDPPKLPRSHEALRLMPFSAILTANHDTLLEKALPQYADSGLFTPHDTEPLIDAFAPRRPFLLKLYGIIDKPETLILAPFEYRELINSNIAFLKFIEGMFASQTVFFAGLSLDGIQEFLSATPFRGGSQPRKHFALSVVEGSASWRTKAELLERRFNVTVIPCLGTARHEEFESFLVQLGGRFRKSAKQPALPAAPKTTLVPGIRRLILEDIGSFERLELDFDAEHKWKVLLGDNGVGKSTVLKAIAVAVIGEEARKYAGRLVRAGKTLGRITVITDTNRSGYITEILTNGAFADARIDIKPSTCLAAESWLAIGFSPLRSVSWRPSMGTQPVLAVGRSVAEDVVPLLSGEVDARMDQLKQWLVNLDASNRPSQSELRGHEGRVTGLAFSPDGQTLFSGSIDTTVRSWDLANGQLLQVFDGHTGGVNAIAISGDGRALASGSYDRTLQIWDLEGEGSVRRTAPKSQTQILCVGLSYDGSVLGWGSDGGSLRVQQLGRISERTTIVRLESGAIWSMALSSDGQTAFAATHHGTIFVYAVGKGEKSAVTFATCDTSVWSLALSPDGQTLIAGTAKGQISAWDVASKTLRSSSNPFKTGVLSIGISGNGQTYAAGSDSGEVIVVDLPTGASLISSQVSARSIWSVALSPDGQTLAAGSDDSSIYLIPVPRSTMPTQQREVIEKLFEVIATLTDRQDIRFLRVNEANRVIVATAEAPAGIPLEMLSQGLTSLLGWVGYLCQRLKETDPSTTRTPLPCNGYALVLLDEMDAHMHPRWQQVLVSRLKKLFPNVQFIVSTHSPLIAAGLEPEEVVRFNRIETGAIEVTYPEFPLKGMGAAGLLTSDMFGLSSQLDEETSNALNLKRLLTGQLLRGGLDRAEEDKIVAEIAKLNESLESVDATMSLRDPLYVRFVKLIAKAGEAEIPSAPLTVEQQRTKDWIAEEIAAQLSAESEGGDLTS